jgi:cysteinyl-tRNA synthetase
VEQAVARRDGLRNAFTLSPAGDDETRWQAFVDALEDDFDTPAALAVLHEYASERQLRLLARGLEVFGLGSLAEREEVPPAVHALAGERAAARAAGDFEAADRLREELRDRGWEMRDEPNGGFTLVRG